MITLVDDKHQNITENTENLNSEQDDFLGFTAQDGKEATEKYMEHRQQLKERKITPAELSLRQSQRIYEKESVLPVYITQIPKNKQNTEECIMAKQTELKKLTNFDVFEEVPNLGQECISTRWVLWLKGEEVRARLVARGFEEGITLL